MDQNELLIYVTAVLERHNIRYGITGSHASNIYGETRFTNDIDVVIQLSSLERLNELLADFPAGSFYVSDIGARHAVEHGGQFKIVHEDSSQKIDFIIPESSAWPDPLARRHKLVMGNDRVLWIIAAEDLILRKMDFYREGGSDKHLRDIAASLRISSENIDLQYISQWSGKLGLTDIWQGIQQNVAP